MKSELQNLETTKVKLVVTVPVEELKPAIDKAYKEVANQVQIPGFRKGKVPAQIIDRRFGRGYILEQAVNEKLGEFYGRALDESDVQVLGQPEIEIVELPALQGPLTGELVFNAVVDIVPEFELPSTEGLKLTVSKLEVTDDEVEQELDRLRERFGTLKEVKRKAKTGDFTSIDMVAKVDGQEVDSVSGVSYQIGQGNMLEGTDKALRGMKSGEETTFETTLAGGEHAGEKAEVTIKVNSVKERELPAADDDFAQMASEFDTIGELRADLRKNLEESHKQQQALEAREKLQDFLVEGAKFDLAPSYVEAEVERLSERQPEADKEELKKSVEKQTRQQIVTDKVAEQTGAEVGGQELYQMIFEIAQMYGIEPMQLLQNQQQVAAMARDLRANKGLVQVLREVEIVDEEGTKVDLSEFLKDPVNEEEAEQSEE